MSNGPGLLGPACLLATLAGTASAQNAQPPLEEVVVTGFRASLESSTEAKKESTGFTDSIFAEDIGKFPDTNIAETFNRVPGITISREISGEGLNIAIRGLGTNFTKILLNGAPVAVASTGRTDAQNTNREVDLDLFPTELFTQLTVHKSASAHMLEGGAAGTVDMRSARPFDHGAATQNLTYSFQGTRNTESDDWGGRGSILGSKTWDTFGVLFGRPHSAVLPRDVIPRAAATGPFPRPCPRMPATDSRRAQHSTRRRSSRSTRASACRRWTTGSSRVSVVHLSRPAPRIATTAS
jgi:TonB-dependent receptor